MFSENRIAEIKSASRNISILEAGCCVEIYRTKTYRLTDTAFHFFFIIFFVIFIENIFKKFN